MKTLRILKLACFVLVFTVLAGTFSFTGKSFLKQYLSNPLVHAQTDGKMSFFDAPSDQPTNFFNNYTSWRSSAAKKSDDYMIQALYYAHTGGNGGTLRTFLDINGDGLSDFLYMYEGYQYVGHSDYLVLLNSGNNNFTVGYQCVMSDKWYGDCAQ
ncbi:hypothetical protein HYV57_05770 [Candidatus Peregrinibacteria bacterium]|nr:hypothetical protein [Candidatus Peregrinibacteria bacterium]